jgi:hypothetical protein
MTRICPGSRADRAAAAALPVPPLPATMRKDIERLSFSPPPMMTSPTSMVWLVLTFSAAGRQGRGVAGAAARVLPLGGVDGQAGRRGR